MAPRLPGFLWNAFFEVSALMLNLFWVQISKYEAAIGVLMQIRIYFHAR